jgi:hypothetical protein
MGRGIASKGKRDMSGPSWLKPEGEDGGGGGVRMEEEQPKRRQRDEDEDHDPKGKKKGIQWKPIAFLLLMILPGLAPVLFDLFDKLSTLGALKTLPGYHLLTPNPYRPCLRDFYADWAPEKLGTLDETLSSYEGRERQLFGKLQKKYGKKANFERCKPKEEKKKS